MSTITKSSKYASPYGRAPGDVAFKTKRPRPIYAQSPMNEMKWGEIVWGAGFDDSWMKPALRDAMEGMRREFEGNFNSHEFSDYEYDEHGYAKGRSMATRSASDAGRILELERQLNSYRSAVKDAIAKALEAAADLLMDNGVITTGPALVTVCERIRSMPHETVMRKTTKPDLPSWMKDEFPF